MLQESKTPRAGGLGLVLILTVFACNGALCAVGRSPLAPPAPPTRGEQRELHSIARLSLRIDTPKKGREKEFAESCQALADLMHKFRERDAGTTLDARMTEKASELHGDFSVVSGWKFREKSKAEYFNPRLPVFLELACLKILSKEREQLVVGFKMLDYADQNTDGLDRCRSLYKYGEVLREIGEPGRAKEYLETALAYGRSAFKPKKPESPGETTEKVPGTAEWAKLRKKIEYLLLLVSFDLLEKQFGPEYALYVKMRTFHDKGDLYEAFVAAARLKDEYPETICGDIGRFYWCRMLIGNDHAGLFRDRSLPNGEKEMKKFIDDKPYGTYRGAAWMELGRASLQYDWDADKAAKYYKEALAWFRTVRSRKNLADLYSIPAKLQSVAAPRGPITALNKWKRIEYRKLDPKEIITAQNAPWYVSEMEKECLFMVGFFSFIEGDTKTAKKLFHEVGRTDKKLAALDAKGIPNTLWRLRSACHHGYMVFPPEEKKFLRKDNKLKIACAELYYLTEKFADAKRLFADVLQSPESSPYEKAMAHIGLGSCADMISGNRQEAIRHLKKAVQLGGKTPIAGNALIRLGCFVQNSTKTADEGPKYLKIYIKRFSGGRYEDIAMFRLALADMVNRGTGGIYLSELKKNHPESPYLTALGKIKKSNSMIIEGENAK